LKVANCAKRVKNAAEAACTGLAFPFEPKNWQIGAFVFEPVWMLNPAAQQKRKMYFSISGVNLKKGRLCGRRLHQKRLRNNPVVFGTIIVLRN